MGTTLACEHLKVLGRSVPKTLQDIIGGYATQNIGSFDKGPAMIVVYKVTF
jgi:hypothetical protein